MKQSVLPFQKINPREKTKKSNKAVVESKKVEEQNDSDDDE